MNLPAEFDNNHADTYAGSLLVGQHTCIDYWPINTPTDGSTHMCKAITEI